MSSLSDTVKKTYRSAVPSLIRKSKPATKLAAFTARLLGHDAIYDAEYYATSVERAAVRSADLVSESIYREFHPKTVVDVGCGTGALLDALKKKGCSQVFGLEYSAAALQYCRARGLDVRKFDLESDRFLDGRRFDVAISMEVAEHLSPRIADSYVDLLNQLSDRIIFTAAQPGQGGWDHLNEQLPLYWISKFNARGFTHAEELAGRWRDHWRDGSVEDYYCNNLMLFLRG
jgi:SAM-dependent methyltransferase